MIVQFYKTGIFDSLNINPANVTALLKTKELKGHDLIIIDQSAYKVYLKSIDQSFFINLKGAEVTGIYLQGLIKTDLQLNKNHIIMIEITGKKSVIRCKYGLIVAIDTEQIKDINFGEVAVIQEPTPEEKTEEPKPEEKTKEPKPEPAKTKETKPKTTKKAK